ncbi:MAG: hypothetical protein HFJ38_07270 [Bacilli bacterium]|nr:hypothetical protein [Bacilli bacterium]
MKNLLQSKGFKKNLLKWLFMYCGVMCILTIVVTYSRYLSSQSYQDTAKVAKFDINVEAVSCSEMDSGDIRTTPNNVACIDNNSSAGSLRPDPKVGFYFKVDTSKLEVNANVIISMILKNSIKNAAIDNTKYFSNYKLYDVTDIAKKNTLDLNQTQVLPFKNIDENTTETDTTTNINLIESVGASKGKNRIYMLVMDYNYEDSYSQEDLISIGYSATQVID